MAHLTSPVPVHLVPIGGADRLIEKRRTLPPELTVRALRLLLQRQLGINEPVYIFVRGFAPSPENSLWDLYQHFKEENELVVRYSRQLVFG
jgi:hypothetical protein